MPKKAVKRKALVKKPAPQVRAALPAARGKATFRYAGTLPGYVAHADEVVLIVRALALWENEQHDMYLIRAADGWEGHAHDRELRR